MEAAAGSQKLDCLQSLSSTPIKSFSYQFLVTLKVFKNYRKDYLKAILVHFQTNPLEDLEAHAIEKVH